MSKTNGTLIGDGKLKRPQSIEDEFQQIITSSNALKNKDNGDGCLDEEALQSLWYSIAAVSSKKELRKRILPFYEEPEERKENETFILLEILEFLYSKNGFQPLLKCLDDETIVDFLSYCASNGTTRVQKQSLYLIALICQKLKTSGSEIAGILELQEVLMKENKFDSDASLESKYFLESGEKNSVSPPKRDYLKQSKNLQASRFETLFTKAQGSVKAEELKQGSTELSANQDKDLHKTSQEECSSQENGENNLSSEESQEYYVQAEVLESFKKFSNDSSDLFSLDGAKTMNFQDAKIHNNGQNSKNVKIDDAPHGDFNNVTLDTISDAALDNTQIESFFSISHHYSDVLTQNKRDGNKLQVNTDKQAGYDPILFLNDSINTSLSQKSTHFQNPYLESPIIKNLVNDSPMSLPTNSPFGLQESNKSVLEQLSKHNASKGCLQLDELLEFKRVNCPNKNCPLKTFISSQEQFVLENDMYQCPYFHNHADRRRYPLHKHNLAKSFYVHDKLCEDCFNDPNKHKGRCYYCKNWFEVFFHPKNYKLVPCQNRLCNKTNSYCPFFHHVDEKFEWDQVLMSGFQYDRSNVTFSVEVLANTSGQNKAIINNINMFSMRMNQSQIQQSPSQSPSQSPLFIQFQQFGQQKVQSPFLGHQQGFQQPQSPFQQPQSPFQQSQVPFKQAQSPFMNHQQNFQQQVQSPYNQQGFNQQKSQSPFMYHNNSQQHQMHLCSPQLARNVPINQQKHFSPQPWANNECRPNVQPSNQPNQDQLTKLRQMAGIWDPNLQNKSSTNAMPQTNSGKVPSNHMFKQLVSPFPNQQTNTFNSDLYMPNQFGGISTILQTNNFHDIAENHQEDEHEHTQNGDLVEVNEKDCLIKNKSLNNETFTEENKRFEFKNFKGPTFDERQKEQLLKTVCGFLNGDGGKMYIGINDLGKVIGTSMNYKQYDNFKGDFVSALLEQFSPPVDDSLYSLKRYFVLDAPKQYIDINSWKNIVIEVSIKSGDKVYFIKEKGRQLCYQRFDGSTRALQGDQINDLFRKKIMDSMAKQQ